MKCSRCKQRCNIHWDGICDACKLNDTIQENKKLREALIKTNKVLHDLSYDDSSCFHKVTRIVKEALEDTK